MPFDASMFHVKIGVEPNLYRTHTERAPFLRYDEPNRTNPNV